MFRMSASGLGTPGCPPWVHPWSQVCGDDDANRAALRWLRDGESRWKLSTVFRAVTAAFHDKAMACREQTWAAIVGRTTRLPDQIPAEFFAVQSGGPMKPGETRQDRLKRVAAEKAAKNLLAMAADDVACAAPDPKRRPGHSRRPDWTLGGRKR